MRKISSALVAVAATATAALGLATQAQAADVGGAGNPHVHLLLTRQAVQHTLGVSTGCLGTGSPGCIPIPLQYNGGPVEQAGTTNYAIFWEPTGSFVAPTYNSLIQRFFGDIGGSGLYGVATQYYQSVGSQNQDIVNSSHFGGSWVDTAPYPPSAVQDIDLQAEVAKAMTANGWTGGIGHQFYVYLAKGESQCNAGACSFSTYCAYHGDFGSNGQTVLYASMPYDGTNLAACGTQSSASPNNDIDADAEISTTSHELMETVTDPTISAWYDATGSEIGDKCAYTYGPTSPNGADITMNGNPYIVQEEFSNSALGCTLS
ncbi:MAG TPA: hypothetical protein VNG13_05740 [Mycobacteriales bacterium]|nr:hypothetical protein [Mycobacteriales bacterium]